MIDLCDQTRYYSDNALSNQANQLPRPTEDIVIAGLVYNEETISFPNSCELNTISSITLNFAGRRKKLNLKGDAVLDPNNPRKPSAEEIFELEKTNPQRVAHGWYTISPKYTIGNITCNAPLVLDNIGLNSNSIQCSSLESKNSALAGNSLSVRSIIFDRGYAYDCQVSSTGVESNGFKSDGMTFNTSNLTNDLCSFAESTFNIGRIQSNGTSYVDCNLQIEKNSEFKDDFFSKSNISSSNDTELLFIGGNDEESSFNGQQLFFTNYNFSGSSVTTEKIGLENVLSFKSDITAENCTYARITNFGGSLTFTNISGFDITNTSGNLSATKGPIGANSNLNNGPGSIASFTSGIISRGQNDGIIDGSFLIFERDFINNYIINAEECWLSGATNGNSGIIGRANLTRGANNYGKINDATFYQNSQNAGLVKKGTFYEGSFNSTNIIDCDFLSEMSFRDKSANFGDTHCLITFNFYDDSLNNGDIAMGHFHDWSRCGGSIFNSVIFDDNSSFTILNIENYNSGLTIECNDNCKGDILNIIDPSLLFSITVKDSGKINTLFIGNLNTDEYNINVYDSGTILRVDGVEGGLAEINFYDASRCGGSNQKTILHDGALANGDFNELYMNDESIAIKVDSVKKLYIKDKARFQGTSIDFGSIEDEAVLEGENGEISYNLLDFENATNSTVLNASENGRIVFDNSINLGTLNNGNLRFTNASINSGLIDKKANAIFLSNSHNSGIIRSANAYYLEGSSNKGSGIGHTMYFGPGSANYFYVAQGYFFEGSENFGIVSQGVFHPSISQTGTVFNYITNSQLVETEFILPG